MLSSLTSPNGLENGRAVNESVPAESVGRLEQTGTSVNDAQGVALNLSSHGLTLARIVAALSESARVDDIHTSTALTEQVARTAEDMRPPYLPLDGIADMGRLAQAVQAAKAVQGSGVNPFASYSSDKLMAMVSDEHSHFYTADEVRAARSLLLERMQRMADDHASAQARVAAATQPANRQDAAHDPTKQI